VELLPILFRLATAVSRRFWLMPVFVGQGATDSFWGVIRAPFTLFDLLARAPVPE
jgi:hypothetical protein